MSLHGTNSTTLTATFPSSLHTLNVPNLSLLVSTNDAPTEFQRISLETALAQHTADVTILYQRIEECKMLHLRLHQVLQSAKGDVCMVKAIIHPVQVLPPELLKEIFMYGRKGGYNACISTADNLWSWSQVCHQWRDVCITVPSLWSVICLDFVSDDSLHLSNLPYAQHALRVLDKHVSHCAGLPLDITIIASHLEIIGNALVKCVLCRCSQWHFFSMDAPEGVWHSLNNCAGSLGGLKSLTINDSYHRRIASTGSPSYMHTILSAFTFVPNLRSLSIAEIPLHALAVSPTTFQNLKVFQVHLYNQASTVLELLPHMSSVSCLELTCNGTVKPFNCMIELPSVISLTLQDGDSPNGLPMVWSLLQLKNLHTLSLCYEGNILSPAWPHLSSPDCGITLFRLSYTESVHDFDYHNDASIVLLH
ncbi:hypothetical protein EDD85DRAFT_946544 [Armillaria nabsnona]|nr:hypothetical protein EDD85DRAFT_946544 [Armillaria nabsnona]